MGYYLETGTPHGKARILAARYDAMEVSEDEAEFFLIEDTPDDRDIAVICVVDNGPFEAAAFCYNLDEFRVFTHPDDPRPRTWLVTSERERVEQDAGFARARV